MFTPEQKGRPASPQPDLQKNICGSCAACQVRLNSSTDPRLLPCLHIVCNTCLTKICTDGATQDCPLCAQSFSLSDVTKCAIFEDMSKNNKALKCAGCEESEVTGWCVQCEEALCLDCTSAHHRVKVTRNHEVTPKKPPEGWTQRRRCLSHPQESLRFFCLVCEELTCKDCQLITHRGHSFLHQEEAVETQRKHLQSLLDSIRQQKEMLSRSLLLLEARLQDIEDIKVAAKKMMLQVFQNLYRNLIRKLALICHEIHVMYEEEVGLLLEKKTYLNRLEKCQDYISAFIDNILGTEGHCLLVHTKRIENQVKRILSQETCTPETMITLQIQIQRNLYDQIVKLGFLKFAKFTVPFSSERTGSTQSASLSTKSSNPNSVKIPNDVHPTPVSSEVTQVAFHPCGSSQSVQMNQGLPHSSQPSQPSHSSQATTQSSSHHVASSHLTQSKPPSSDPQCSYSSSPPSAQVQSHDVISGQSKDACSPSSNYVLNSYPSAPKPHINPSLSVYSQPHPPLFTKQTESQQKISKSDNQSKKWTLHYHPTMQQNSQKVSLQMPVPNQNQQMSAIQPPSYPFLVNNQKQASSYSIPAKNQTLVLTHSILADNQTFLPINPIPANNQTPVQSHPIPDNNQTPAQNHPIPGNCQAPILTQSIPVNNPTSVLTHPVPANHQIPLLSHPKPANNQTPVLPTSSQTHKLIQSIPANNQMSIIIEPISFNNQIPLLTHPITANDQTLVLAQPIQSNNQTSILTHAIPISTQSPILAYPISENNQTPVLTQQIPAQNQPPVFNPPNTAKKQTPILNNPTQVNNQTPIHQDSNISSDTQRLHLNHPKPAGLLDLVHGFAAQPVSPVSTVHTTGSPNSGINHCPSDACSSNPTSPNVASVSSLQVSPMYSAPTSGNNIINSKSKRDTHNSVSPPIKALADSACDQDAGVSSTNFTDSDHLESNLPTSTVSETDLKEPSPDPADSIVHQNSLFTTSEKGFRQAEAGQSSTERDSGLKHWSAAFQQLVETTCSSIDSLNATPSAYSPCSTSEDLEEERMTHSTTAQGVFKHSKTEEEENISAVMLENVERELKQLKRSLSVSLVRLPISVPSHGQPLPEFHLTTDTSTDYISVQESQDGEIKHVWRWGKFPVSSSCSTENSDIDSSPASDVQFCAVCESAGAALLCVKCGCAFHFDCYIPPVLTKPCEGWVCLLCQDVNDTVMYDSEDVRTSSLSLQDQKKCEKLLLGLLCDENTYLIYSATKNHSKTPEFEIILGRLLGKRKPPYRTAAELVSDVWTLFDILMINSKNKSVIIKLQKSFQQRLNESFGNILHESLLKHFSSTDPNGTSEPETQREKHRHTLKRMREFFIVNCGTTAKKSCSEKMKDGEEKTTVGED